MEEKVKKIRPQDKWNEKAGQLSKLILEFINEQEEKEKFNNRETTS